MDLSTYFVYAGLSAEISALRTLIATAARGVSSQLAVHLRVSPDCVAFCRAVRRFRPRPAAYVCGSPTSTRFRTLLLFLACFRTFQRASANFCPCPRASVLFDVLRNSARERNEYALPQRGLYRPAPNRNLNVCSTAFRKTFLQLALNPNSVLIYLTTLIYLTASITSLRSLRFDLSHRFVFLTAPIASFQSDPIRQTAGLFHLFNSFLQLFSRSSPAPPPILSPSLSSPFQSFSRPFFRFI